MPDVIRHQFVNKNNESDAKSSVLITEKDNYKDDFMLDILNIEDIEESKDSYSNTTLAQELDDLLAPHDNVSDWTPSVDKKLRFKRDGDRVASVLTQSGIEDLEQYLKNQSSYNRYVLYQQAVRIRCSHLAQYLIEKNHLSVSTTDLHEAAIRGNFQLVQYLINNKKIDVNAMVLFGSETALDKVIEELDGYQKDERSLLQIATFLIENGADISKTYDDDFNNKLSLLQYLLQKRDSFQYSEEFDALIEAIIASPKFNPNAKNELDFTALHTAVDIAKYKKDEKLNQRQMNVVKRLLDHKDIQINAKSNDKDLYYPGETPLFETANGNNLELVQLLLDHGANPNIKNSKGQTPLYHLLVDQWDYFAGNEVKKEDREEKTKIAQLLIERMTDFSESYQCPAYEKYQAPILIYLMLEFPKKVNNADSSQALFNAVLAHKNIKNIIDLTDEYGRDALHIAVLTKDKQKIDQLLEKGANINAQDNNGSSVLHYAAYQGNIDLVKYLIEQKKANPIIFTHQNESILHIAAESGHLECVKYLEANYPTLNNRQAAEGTMALNAAARGAINAAKITTGARSKTAPQISQHHEMVKYFLAKPNLLESLKQKPGENTYLSNLLRCINYSDTAAENLKYIKDLILAGGICEFSNIQNLDIQFTTDELKNAPHLKELMQQWGVENLRQKSKNTAEATLKLYARMPSQGAAVAPSATARLKADMIEMTAISSSANEVTLFNQMINQISTDKNYGLSKIFSSRVRGKQAALNHLIALSQNHTENPAQVLQNIESYLISTDPNVADLKSSDAGTIADTYLLVVAAAEELRSALEAKNVTLAPKPEALANALTSGLKKQ